MTAVAPVRVLVVEDEALLAMDIELTIEDCGHQVVGAARCLRSAEELPDNTDPQLALIDLQLANGSNGIDVSSLVKRRWPDAIIVFVTANVRRIPTDIDMSYATISKPFSHRDMVQAIEYLAEEVSNPPPRAPLPKSLTLIGQSH